MEHHRRHLWKRHADKTGNSASSQHNRRHHAADQVFTIPRNPALLGGGLAAAFVGKIPILSTGWLLWGFVAFILAGLAFGPLARAQKRLSVAAHAGNLHEYEDVSKSWALSGTLALIFPFVAFVLMILKPTLPAFP